MGSHFRSHCALSRVLGVGPYHTKGRAFPSSVISRFPWLGVPSAVGVSSFRDHTQGCKSYSWRDSWSQLCSQDQETCQLWGPSASAAIGCCCNLPTPEHLTEIEMAGSSQQLQSPSHCMDHPHSWETAATFIFQPQGFVMLPDTHCLHVQITVGQKSSMNLLYILKQ